MKTFSPDDPKITAFALGELETADLAEVASAVASDLHLQAAVADIRRTARELEAALAAEPLPDVLEDPIPTSVFAFEPPARRAEMPATRKHDRPFAGMFVMLGAAACFLLVLVIGVRNFQSGEPTLAANTRKAQPAPEVAGVNPESTDAGTAEKTRVIELRFAKNDDKARKAAPAPAPVTEPAVALAPANTPLSNTTTTTAAVPVPVVAADNQPRILNPAEPVIPEPAVVVDNQIRPAPTTDTTIAAIFDPSHRDGGTASRDSATKPIPASPGYVVGSTPPAQTGASDTDNETVIPNPNLPGDSGAQPESVLADSRARTKIEDLNAAVAVVAQKFMHDADPKQDPKTLLTVTNSTEVQGIGGTTPGSPKGRTIDVPIGMLTRSNELGTPDNGPVLLAADDNRFSGTPTATSGNFFPPAPGSGVDGPRFNTESYDHENENRFVEIDQRVLSTFSIDVDTAGYSNVRRLLVSGQRPPHDAIRIEEMVNYFPYDYRAPASTDKAPFAATIETADAPWAPTHRLVRIGIKGREIAPEDRPAANLVVLVDTSDSMADPDKLPLVQESLRILVDQLGPHDTMALAEFSDVSSLRLPSTPASKKTEILAAINQLSIGGAANGSVGLQLAYDVAKANFITGGVNRVIIATDGDFNTGTTDRGELIRLVQDKAKNGITLNTLGFGTGNLKDGTLEQLADNGNGVYAYIDSPREAKRALIEQLAGAHAIIAKDVKVQVEFNPANVQAYRLIGYENRLLHAEDFNNDRIEAGEIDAGHTVTALYEVVPEGVEWLPDGSIDTYRYTRPPSPGDNPTTPASAAKPAELLTVKIRYKEPAADKSEVYSVVEYDRGRTFADASADFKFAAAVASFGMVLRDSPNKGAATFGDIVTWAQQGAGTDPAGHRAEFITLVNKAEQIVR